MWNALSDEDRTGASLYLAQLVENHEVPKESWNRFSEASGLNFEHEGVVALRSVPSEVSAWTGEHCCFLSAGSISALDIALWRLLKVLDVGKLGKPGGAPRALALKKRISEEERDYSQRGQELNRYARVPEDIVAEVSNALAESLHLLSGHFYVDFSKIDGLIDRYTQVLFEQVRFSGERKVVAFTADDSFVFSIEEIQKILKDCARRAATWQTSDARLIMQAWDRVPATIRNIPRYFLANKATSPA
jgi:hypothetical protein